MIGKQKKSLYVLSLLSFLSLENKCCLAANDYEEIYSFKEIRYPHLVELAKWGDEYTSLFEPANGKVAKLSCVFENVSIIGSHDATVIKPCLFVEKSEALDARHLGEPIAFRYSHDNANENKHQSTFKRGSTISSSFNLSLKVSEPISGVGIDSGVSHSASSNRERTDIDEGNESHKNQLSYSVTFPTGGLYLLSTLHVLGKRTYTDYHITANMTIEIEYVKEGDAAFIYEILTKETCFKSVFLTSGSDEKTLNKLILRGDIDTAANNSWMLYGPFADTTQTSGSNDKKVKLRQFMKDPPHSNPTFLTHTIASLNLIKKVNLGIENDADNHLGYVISLIPAVPATNSIISRIAGYL